MKCNQCNNNKSKSEWVFNYRLQNENEDQGHVISVIIMQSRTAWMQNTAASLAHTTIAGSVATGS